MALSVSQQWRYWGIGTVILLFILWALGNVLLPFVLGMAIAYFLDPTADKLEKLGLSRLWATIVITVAALLVVTIIAIVLIPQLVQQLASLITSLPEYLQGLQEFLIKKFPAIMDETSAVREGIDSFVASLQSKGGQVAQALLSSAFGLVDIVVLMVIAPVVAFYMLLDWDRMVATIDGWIPRDHLDTVRSLASQVDSVLAGFVRGQFTVCSILGTFYAVALMVVGLQYGLVVGLIAGLLTFIPYVGSVIGGALAIGLALFQFWDSPEWIVVVAVIFVIGQMVEGNVLTPKLVGGSIGLHPVWLMFALSAFGTLMGFTGMLIAVPVAACLGVFSRFGLGQYLQGRLYSGIVGKKAAEEKALAVQDEATSDE